MSGGGHMERSAQLGNLARIDADRLVKLHCHGPWIRPNTRTLFKVIVGGRTAHVAI
jgi:hypothetical protein